MPVLVADILLFQKVFSPHISDSSGGGPETITNWNSLTMIFCFAMPWVPVIIFY